MESASPDLPIGFAHLAAALAKAQAEFKDPLKNRTADIKSAAANYKYSYADLPAVYEAVRPALAKNGLAIVHDVAMDNGRVFVSTRLLHSSGEAIGNTLSWPAGGRIQELGSSITFLKRYTLCALVGVAADEDDDANTVDNNAAKTEARTNRAASPKKEPEAAAAPSPGDRAELAQLFVDLAKKLGSGDLNEDQVDTLERAFGAARVSSLSDVKVAEMLPKFRAPTDKLMTWAKDKLTAGGLIGQKPGQSRPST